jgi:hypothetical protein
MVANNTEIALIEILKLQVRVFVSSIQLLLRDTAWALLLLLDTTATER